MGSPEDAAPSGMGLERARLRRIRDSLVKYDPEILEIIQFGSSIYAPEYSRDIDLLVLTRREKAYGGYLDAIDEVDPPVNVDVIVLEAGRVVREGFLRDVLGAYEVIYGTGELLRKLAGALGDPSLEEAHSHLRGAKESFELGRNAVNPYDRDRWIREAFDGLFHAVRIASMVYLSTENARWGRLRRRLPETYRDRFEEILRRLHLKYFYAGEYPKHDLEKEFERWFKEAESLREGCGGWA